MRSDQSDSPNVPAKASPNARRNSGIDSGSRPDATWNIASGNVEQWSKAGKAGVDYRVRHTSTGLRLVQQGVVLSEVRYRPGPTHSVFDILAALAHALKPSQRIGLLGFAGGSVLAPLRYLSTSTPVQTVDLDPSGYALFKKHCSDWAGDLTWHRAEAVHWLRQQAQQFPVLIDDLSILAHRRVIKPEISTRILPRLMQSRLEPHGVVISNLLRPVRESWRACLANFTRHFSAVRLVCLDEFENQIVLAAQELPSSRELGRKLRGALTYLRSRQAGRVQVHTLA
jgi:spermidine synthase